MKRPSAGYLMKKKTELKDPNTGVMIYRSIRKLSGLILLLLVSFTWVAGQKAECFALHMDKSFYVSGETIWYKLYQMNDTSEVKIRVLNVDLINDQNEIIVQQKILISNRTGYGSIAIPMDSNEGYYRFRAFTTNYLNFSSAIYEKRIPVFQMENGNDISISNKIDKKLEYPESSGVSVVTEEKIYDARDSLKVTIRIDPSKYQGKGNFSVSIVPLELAAREMSSFGHSECPVGIGEGKFTADQTLFIEGTLLNQDTGEKINSGLISIYTDQSPQLIRGSASDGILKVPVPDFFGSGVFQILNLDPFQPAPLEFIPYRPSKINGPYDDSEQPVRSQVVMNYLSKLEKRRMFVELFDLYKSEDTKYSTVSPRKADAVYHTADYKQIYSFEEFINEAIRNVKVRTIKGVKTVRLFSKEMGKLFMDHPWYIIDGYLTFDEKEVLEIQYEDILEVRLYTKPSTINEYFERFMWRNGIMEIVTRDVKYTRMLKNNPNVVEIEGFSILREFGNSLYLSESMEIPDLRGVMYWSPNVVADETGLAKITIPLSDDTGKFAIIVVGTANFHEVVTGFNTFEVK